VASSDATVMLLGESGTGKEVLAQGLHQARKRGGKFVAINCAAIPRTCSKASCSATRRAPSPAPPRPRWARSRPPRRHLMLDEIGDLPHSLQAKLLRFLQERVIERIGGRQEIPVDVRVVCATHQDLKA
jgi:two-component system NtrC family response regulator